MDIVCFGQQNWDVCWTGKQHLMSRLAARGHRVLYVNPTPLGVAPGKLSAVQALLSDRRSYSLEPLAANLWQFHCHRLPRVHALAQAHLLRRALNHLQMYNPVALCMTPFQRKLVRAIDPFAIAYYTVDEWCGFNGTPEEQKPWIRAEEEGLAAEADVVMAVSPLLCDRLRRVNPHCYLLENGVDTRHFSPARLAEAQPLASIAALSRPRIGFVGQIDARLDQELLRTTALQHPEWQFVLVGRVVPNVDFEALLSVKNIHFAGYVPYEELPSALREFDLCIVPYRANALTHSCNPLKIYEYLATGLPVVSTALEGLGEARRVIHVARDHAEFQERIAAGLRADDGAEERLRAARECSWERRVDSLVQRLEEATHRAIACARRRRHSFPGVHRIAHNVPLDAKEESLVRLRRSSAPMSWQLLFFQFARAAGILYFALRVVARLLLVKRPIRVRKILITRHGCLGDLVTFMPMIAALRKKHPRAKIVLGVRHRSATESLFSGSKDIDEVQVLDFLTRASRLDRLGGALTLFFQGYDLLVSGISYFQVNEGYFSGAPFRAGLYDRHPLQQYSNALVPLDPNRHESDNNLAIAESLGCSPALDERFPVVRLNPTALEGAWNQLNREVQLPPNGHYILLHAGAKQRSRRWPVERFASLVSHVLEKYPSLHVVLTGTPNEQNLGDVIHASVSDDFRARICNTIGRTGLHAVSGLIDRARVVVSNDTGVMHLARARGVPLLGLLGPENEMRWGVYPLGLAPASTVQHRVPCAPCRRDICGHHYCMKLLDVREAAAALDELLNEPSVNWPSITVNGYGKELIQVRARNSVHSWKDLHEAGFPLPLVAVVMDAADETSVRALQNQEYPNIMRIPVHSIEDIDGWKQALNGTDADYFCAGGDCNGWSPVRIGDDVASLLRAPDAAGTARGEFYLLEEVTLEEAVKRGMMISREGLATEMDRKRERERERLSTVIPRRHESAERVPRVGLLGGE